MRRNPWTRWAARAVLSTAALLTASPMWAQGDKAPPAAEAGAKDSPEGKPAQPDAPLVAPEGNDPKALKLYLNQVMRNRPKQQTPDAIKGFLESVRGAGEEILKREFDDVELQSQAASVQIQALSLMGQFGVEDAGTRLEQLMATLEKDPRPGVTAVIAVSKLEQRVSAFADEEPAEQKAIVTELADKLSAPVLVGDYLSLAQNLARMLEYMDQTDEAKAVLTLFADRLEARKDEDPQLSDATKQLAASFRGTARRLDLVGRPIEISGTTIDGHPFDIADWKGKVVLVDFWATWCGPCIQELPNVVAHYKAYHDKGFEVVGISLDESADDLKEFLKERKIPWTNLFEPNTETQGFGNPLARKYGISGIPSCILVDQKGNVVSLTARGPKLGELLTKLLGPAEISEEKAKEPKKDE